MRVLSVFSKYLIYQQHIFGLCIVNTAASFITGTSLFYDCKQIDELHITEWPKFETCWFQIRGICIKRNIKTFIFNWYCYVIKWRTWDGWNARETRNFDNILVWIIHVKRTLGNGGVKEPTWDWIRGLMFSELCLLVYDAVSLVQYLATFQSIGMILAFLSRWLESSEPPPPPHPWRHVSIKTDVEDTGCVVKMWRYLNRIRIGINSRPFYTAWWTRPNWAVDLK